jgi:hypothetical protein
VKRRGGWFPEALTTALTALIVVLFIELIGDYIHA